MSDRSAADRHFRIFEMMRRETPIDPDKAVPGLPQNTTPVPQPQPQEKPKPLKKQKIMAQMMRGY